MSMKKSWNIYIAVIGMSLCLAGCVAVQPLSKGIEIADKDYKGIRQGLILFSACQCFHHHLAVVVPASFSQGFLLSHLHFHVVMGMVLILRIDVQADAFVFGMVDDALLPAHNHMSNGKSKHHLQKSLTVFLHAHDCTKKKVILDCQVL